MIFEEILERARSNCRRTDLFTNDGPYISIKVVKEMLKIVQEEQIENDCFCIEQNTDMDAGNCYINPTTLKKETRRVIV